MLMILFQMQRMDFFVPQLFAAAGNLHSIPVNSAVPSEALIQYDAAFSFCVTTVPPQHTADN